MFVFKYGVSTYFCFELIDPSAREVCIFRTRVGRDMRGVKEGSKREHGISVALGGKFKSYKNF